MRTPSIMTSMCDIYKHLQGRVVAHCKRVREGPRDAVHSNHGKAASCWGKYKIPRILSLSLKFCPSSSFQDRLIRSVELCFLVYNNEYTFHKRHRGDPICDETKDVLLRRIGLRVESCSSVSVVIPLRRLGPILATAGVPVATTAVTSDIA